MKSGLTIEWCQEQTQRRSRKRVSPVMAPFSFREKDTALQHPHNGLQSPKAREVLVTSRTLSSVAFLLAQPVLATQAYLAGTGQAHHRVGDCRLTLCGYCLSRTFFPIHLASSLNEAYLEQCLAYINHVSICYWFFFIT